jgi:uncharacterized protein YndB with AHSA1/START domain
MPADLVAKSITTIKAPLAKVWDALINPTVIKRYMFGATVESEWKKGSPITWSGEWKGKPYQDKGRILELQPEHRLRYSHFSPLTGEPDVPENYHNVTIDLSPLPDEHNAVQVVLSQDNNKTQEAREHSQKNWEMMLSGLKKAVEG